MQHNPAMTEPANDNHPHQDSRPGWYDALLLQYLPMLRKYAYRFVKSTEVDDFVSEVSVLALHRWHHFNPDISAPSTWFYLMMRNAASDRRQYARRGMRTGRQVDIDNLNLASQPTQETDVELSGVLAAMPAGRDGDILLRYAMGEELSEIGEGMGIGRERTRQLKARGLSTLRQRLGMEVAA